MAGNLTLAEARRRFELLTVESYLVHIDLTQGPDTFRSTTSARFSCAEPGAGTFLELANADIHSVVLNGRRLRPSCEDDRIALSNLQADNEVEVVADCRYTHSGEGLHRFDDPADGLTYLYSHFAPADAHRMFACFDQPNLKARFGLTVVAPDGWEVVSVTSPKRARDGKSPGMTWHFPLSEPLPTYALSLVAGPYHVATDGHGVLDDGRDVPLQLFCRASLAPYLDTEVLFDITRQGFGFFHDMFGVQYPFTKYDQIFVPEFNLGGMENAASVSLNEKYIFRSRPTAALRQRRAETVLHEMAHMWFGNLVTMQWWDDLWLNESFATYAGLHALSNITEWSDAWAAFADQRKAEAHQQDQLPTTHPITADIPDVAATEVNFDAITYLKGASVIKQLVSYVGLENFSSALGRYMRRHAWGNTNLTDFLAVLEETSGRDLSDWSREWLRTSGVNTLRLELDYDRDGRVRASAVIQEMPRQHPVLRSHRVAVGLYDEKPEGFERRRRIELDVTGTRTEVRELVGEVRPSFALLNDDDLTYAKVRLDAGSLRTVLRGRDAHDGCMNSVIRDPLAAALVWALLWDMTRDGELAASDYVAIVAARLPAVRDATLAQTLVERARKAVYDYTAPQRRECGLRLLADSACELLRTAEPGSELQLVHFDAFRAIARSPGHVALLRTLLDEAAESESSTSPGYSGVFPGLAVDAEVRWAVLYRLVALGDQGPDAISAELHRDPSAAGERHAAACRAAIPTAQAKAVAWGSLLAGELTGGPFRGAIAGFTELDHRELVSGFDEAYFREVNRVWRDLAGARAQRFARELFPAGSISELTVDAAEAAIFDEATPPALRRLLAEACDEIRRALRARHCDEDAAATRLRGISRH